MLKIIHLPDSFLPESTGGKEVYTFQLNAELLKLGYDSSVLLESEEGHGEKLVNGVKVLKIPKARSAEHPRFLYQSLAEGLEAFEGSLHEHQPDIVHFHDQNNSASLSHLKIVKKLGIKVALTYHSPGQSCPQRSLLFQNKELCDGVVEQLKCTQCLLSYFYKIPPFSAQILAGYLPSFYLPHKGILKPLNSKAMVKDFEQSFREFMDLADAIVVNADWCKELLIKNTVEEQKIHMIRIGGYKPLLRNPSAQKQEKNPLKIVFIGRPTEIKGIHLLIDAVKLLPKDLNIKVYFFSPAWSSSEYGKKMQEKIKDDPRFAEPRLVPNGEILQELSKMDVCVIPSVWPETGPLTYFDAMAAGIPVIGTGKAGLKELIQEGENGVTFKWNDAADLSEKIHQFYLKPIELKQSLPIRSFQDVAQDYDTLYQQLANINK